MAAAKFQTITLGEERAVIVPIQTWEHLLERLEELEDQALYDESMADPDEETIEHDELLRQFGMCPLRYLRNLAGMTQTELARRTGLSQSFIAKVEANTKRLSPSSRRRIARALRLPESRLTY